MDEGTRNLAAAPDARAEVPCPLKSGAQIGVGRCVEWQRENGRHCEHALFSLRRIEKHLAEGAKTPQSVEDAQDREAELASVRELTARAEQIEKSRPPALPPAKEMEMGRLTDKTCEWKESPCGERLGDQNKTGLCNRHNAVMYARRKAGTAGIPRKPKKPRINGKPVLGGGVSHAG